MSERPQSGLNTLPGWLRRWESLPPGWRWVLWGIGAWVSSLPMACKVAYLGIAGIEPSDMGMSLLLAGGMILGFAVVDPARSAGKRGISPVIWIPVVLAGLWVLGWLAWEGSRPTRRQLCFHSLHEIGAALRAYEQKEGRLPDADGIAALAHCYQRGDHAYDLDPALLAKTGDPSRLPVLWDHTLHHENGALHHRMVLFRDEHVECMRESDFQAMLAKGSR